MIVEDQALLGRTRVLDGLRDDGYLLVDSGQRIHELPLPRLTLLPEWAITVPATELAKKLTGRPAANVALLGAFAALSGAVRIESVRTAIQQWFRAVEDLARVDAP